MSKPCFLSSTVDPLYYKIDDSPVTLLSHTNGFNFNGTSSTELYIILDKVLKINLAPIFSYIPSDGVSILVYDSRSQASETAIPCMLQINITDGSYFFYYPDPTTQKPITPITTGVVTTITKDNYFNKIKNTLTGKYSGKYSGISIDTSHISMWVWLIIIIIAIVVSSVITFYVTKIKLK